MPTPSLPDIPLPPGAKTGDDWTLITEGPDAGLYYRCVDWGDTWGNEMVVGITGVQFSDGRVHRHLAVNFDDIHGKEQTADVSADTARELAILLTGAANRFNRSDGTAEKLAQATAEMQRVTQALNAAAEKMRSSWSKPRRDNNSRGDEMTQVAEPHPALAHRCPFCGAEPGQPCRTHRGQGRELDWPHSRRLSIVNDWMRRERPTEQALCCECGNLRTCKQPRNYLAERCDNQTWHRMTGDLKCNPCGRTTRHALLRSGEHRDTAEDYQRMALGGQPGDRLEDVDRARREYRLGLPRNPYLNHRRWTADAEKAWDDGTKKVIALCGEPIEVKVDPRRRPAKHRGDGYLIAEQLSDTEYEDPDTGMSWLDMDCVDCIRVSNQAHHARRRKLLEAWLAWFARRPEAIPDNEAEEVMCVLEPLVQALHEKD